MWKIGTGSPLGDPKRVFSHGREGGFFHPHSGKLYGSIFLKSYIQVECMSKMNICKNEVNWTCRNIEVVVDNPLKGISHPVFYGDLVYKLRRVKDTPNFISSGSKIVKRLRRRQYDPLIIETTIGLVLGPCTALCRLFLKHCTLTNKAVGTIWQALSKPPKRRQGPDLRPLWLLVGTPSAIRPELAFSRAEHSLPYSDVTIYIFAILYLSSMPYV